MKKIKYIIGILLTISLFSLFLSSKAIAISNDSDYRANKTPSIYKSTSEEINTFMNFNCDSKMLILGNPNVDPKMLIPANSKIDEKIFIASAPGVYKNSPVEQSQIGQASRASTSKGD